MATVSFGFVLTLFTLELIGMLASATRKCHVKYDVSRCYSVDKLNFSDAKCDDSTTCRKSINVSHILTEPYNMDLLSFLLRMCCGPCTNISITQKLNHIWEVNDSTIQHSQVVFPVLGHATSSRLHGYYFIPFIETPTAYYTTRKDSEGMIHLIQSCVNLWPFILICLLLAAIAGFLIWALETRGNPDEFPSSFFIGWFEGFWWGVVTMTTVGYGDRIPKSRMARGFSIIWIMTGIALFSVITASLSTEMHKANYPYPPTMTGKKVGAIRHRTYEASMIARHGGLLVDIEGTNTTMTFLHLIKLLRNHHIDGFLVDRYTYIRTCSLIKEGAPGVKGFEEDIEFLHSNTIQTEQKNIGSRLSFGMLVKNREDYEYFADYVANNLAAINACCGLVLNNATVNGVVGVHGVEMDLLFSVDNGLFWPVLITMGCLMAVMCCCGFAYEAYRGP